MNPRISPLRINLVAHIFNGFIMGVQPYFETGIRDDCMNLLILHAATFTLPNKTPAIFTVRVKDQPQLVVL